MNNKQIILGIDPGTTATGFAFLSVDKKKTVPIDFGVIKIDSKTILQKRISEIYTRIKLLIEKYNPDEASIETIFYAKNIRSILSLGEARGVVILALAEKNIPIFEYSPREIKKSVVGNGNASKQQIQYMVKTILNLKETPTSFDATDALAIALCHHQKNKSVI
ncbi:MAG: crossover junction endodeoxyribonuclease RuvC [Candidatus Cloacimonetes bacterium]|nr:crossover junction endodeoxyribonuclease RuvC [Candidatus Cloacimonadota bacterium]